MWIGKPVPSYRFRNPHEILGGRDGEREGDAVLAVDRRLVEQQVQHLAALLSGQAVEAFTDPVSPLLHLLQHHALIGLGRFPRAVLVQPRPEALQPLADEPALVVELPLGDFPDT